MKVLTWGLSGLMVLAGQTNAAAADWNVQRISPGAGYSVYSVSNVNDLGQVAVGARNVSTGESLTFLSDSGLSSYKALPSTVPKLGGIGFTDLYPRDLNNLGQIAGLLDLDTSESPPNGYFTGPSGVNPQRLDPSIKVVPFALNDLGQIAGYYVPTGGGGAPSGVSDYLGIEAFVTAGNALGAPNFLTLANVSVLRQASNYIDINNTGQLVGRFGSLIDSRLDGAAFVTSALGVDPSVLKVPGTNFNFDTSARAINDRGQVAGTVTFIRRSPVTGAFFTSNEVFLTDSSHTEIKVLPLDFGDDFVLGSVSDVDDEGRVLGDLFVRASALRLGAKPFLTGPDGEGWIDLSLIDLPDGTHPKNALSINDLGQIFVKSGGFDPYTGAFSADSYWLLSPSDLSTPAVPVPEPATWVLSALGFFFVSMRVRRARHAGSVQHF